MVEDLVTLKLGELLPTKATSSAAAAKEKVAEPSVGGHGDGAHWRSASSSQTVVVPSPSTTGAAFPVAPDLTLTSHARAPSPNSASPVASG